MISPELLRRHTFFNGFSVQDLEELAMTAREIAVPSGEVVFHEGEHAEALHFLADGEMEILINAEGESISLSTLPSGEPLGWSALIDPHLYTATARATRNCRVIVFDRQELLKQLADDHFAALFMKKIAEVVSRRLKDTQIQLLSLTAKQPA
jgi:CRP-like cAMP-binding protein